MNRKIGSIRFAGRLSLLLCLLLAAGAACRPASAARWPERLDAQAEAFDGGEVRFDGMYYDFRAADGMQQMKMWVPPNSPRLRGALFHGNPGGYGDTRDIPRDERLQEFAARHDFGIIGVTSFPGGRVYGQLAEIIVKAMDDWAELGYHPELADLPLIARGSSNAGVTAYGLACYAPERMICYTPNVGARYNPGSPPEAALQVPGLLHIGPEDPFFPHGVEETRELFAGARPRGARWAWTAEKGKGHEIGHIDDVDMKFYETCIGLRLPSREDTGKGPVELRSIPEEEGWLVDPTSWDSGITRIAPYDEYKGDRSKAGWVPTADIAFLYRSVATHDNPLKLRIRDVGPVENPHEEGVLLRSVGGNVVDPGRKLVIECDATDFPGWERMEFYHGARKIGEVRRGEEPAAELVVDPEHTVYALTVLAYDAEGRKRTAAPVHFLVRDPQVSAALARQRAAHGKLAPPLPRPPYGSSTREASGETSPANPDDRVLTAYALDADQEKQFAADGAVSPFWGQYTESHDRAALTVKNNLAKRGETWKSVEEPDDARVRIRAAHSRAGLYLLFVVEDDQWAPVNELADSLDFHLARRSSEDIWGADPADVFLKRESFALVLSGNQHQIPVGGDPAGKRPLFRNYPDPWDVARAEEELSSARKRYGISVDLVELGPKRRAVECFLPWEWVGHGEPVEEPEVGSRLALSLGYNDSDPADHEEGAFDRLRWSNRLDPWWQPGNKGPQPSPWGDLEMGPPLSE